MPFPHSQVPAEGKRVGVLKGRRSGWVASLSPFLNKFICLFLERGEGREEDRRVDV